MAKVAHLPTDTTSARMKRREVLEMAAALDAVARLSGSARFAYGIERNRKFVADEREAILAACKPVDGMEPYHAERIALCRDHAEQDEKGNPVTRDGIFVLAEDRREAFDAALAELQEKHAEALTAQKAKDAEVEAFLGEETSVRVHRISLDQWPDGLTADHMRLFWPIVDEG